MSGLRRDQSDGSPTFGWDFWKVFIPFLILIVIVLFFPYLITQKSWVDFVFTEKSGWIGDTLGGVMGPFVAMIAAGLTFMAFWVQYKANEQQREDLKIERFENKFYNLLQIHRSNVLEIEVGKSLNGRKTFVSMFNELKYIYLSTIWFYKANRVSNGFPEMTDDKLYNVAYLVFFFGIGPNSTKIVHDLVGPEYDGFIQALEVYLKGCQTTWRTGRKTNSPVGVEHGEGHFNLDIKYKPCNGHMSKLSHYVRHLYQLVKFVDDTNIESFDYQRKYDYVATIRSQLSNHEQLLLYYNAVSVMGKPWLNEPNLMKKYCVIKSTPLPLADFYKTPLNVLGEKNENGKVMFEWLEIKKRLAADDKN